LTRVRSAPAGAAWFDLIHERIASVRQDDALGPITVLMPSFYSAFFVRRFLAARSPGLFNVNFIRIDDLSDFAGGGDLPRLSRLRASQMVHAVVHAASDDALGILASSRDHPSLPVAMHHAFDDLRPVSGTRLEELRGHDDSGVAGLVIDQWLEFKSRTEGFTDQLISSRSAAVKILADPAAFQKRFGHTIVCLLEDPPPEFHPMLEALHDASRVEWVIGTSGDPSLDAPLIRLAGGEVVESASSESVTTSPVELVSVPDPAEEVRTLIRKILTAASGGTRFGEMAVVFNDPSYMARVLEALGRARITASGADPRTLAEMSEGRFLTGLLDIHASKFSREAVVDWADGGLAVNLSGQPIPAVRWDLITRNAGIVGGADGWSDQLIRYSESALRQAERGEHREELSESQTARLRGDAREASAMSDVVAALVKSPLPTTGSWAEYVFWCKSMIGQFARPQDFEADTGRVAQVLSTLEQIAQLSDIDGPEPNEARFREVLSSELSASLGRVGSLGRGVLVGPLRDVVGVPARLLFVLGMSEGSFPSAVGDDPLLGDALRRQVERAPGVLQTRAEREQVQRREFLNATASASHRVFMWPRSDAGSSAVRGASRWFVEAARVISGDETLQSGQLLDEEQRETAQAIESALNGMESSVVEGITDASEYRLRSVSAHVSGGRRIADHWTVVSDPEGALATGLNVEANRLGPNWTAWDGKLVGESLPVPSVESPISPTRLQSWAACPFSYFAGNILRLEGVERPEEIVTISALDRGTLLHSILEEFVEAQIKSESPISRDEAAQRISEIANLEFCKFETKGMVGRRALWELEKERMLREVVQFVDAEITREAETGFRATATELTFGLEKDGHPAMEIELPSGRRVAFRGAIDRVEGSDSGAISVVDYKTGSLTAYDKMEADPLKGGQLMQLPIYAMAARSIAGGDGDVEGAYWFTSERGGFQTRKVRLGEIEQDALETLDRITEGIGAGVFPANPGPPDRGGFANCTYCPFDQICPTSRDRLWNLKSTAGEIKAVRPHDDEGVR